MEVALEFRKSLCRDWGVENSVRRNMGKGSGKWDMGIVEEIDTEEDKKRQTTIDNYKATIAAMRMFHVYASLFSQYTSHPMQVK